MKKTIFIVASVLFFTATSSFASKRPPLAFTCNAKMGELMGQVQLFASGHSRFVFKKKGQDQAHACWLKAQYVQDQRQATPGGLVAEYLRSDNCQPALEKSLRSSIPSTMSLAIAEPTNAKPHAVIAAEGIPGQYICNITNNRLSLVKTFAVYPEEVTPERGLASESSVYPNFEIWWEEASAETTATP